MEGIKISVIMPVYNEEEYLAESLSAFFEQTIADECELICVDDGSTDSSIKILHAQHQLHPDNMRIIEQQNSGSGRARNHGLAEARGEFIGFLDADDLYPAPETLEHLYRAAVDHDQKIAGGSLVIFTDEVENTEFAGIKGFSGHQFTQEGVVSYRDYQFDYGYQRFIYRRDMLESKSIRFKDYLRYQDPPFFVEAMLAAGSFYALTEQTYRYRTAAKQVKWTTRKACDMIHAITDVGAMAARNDLEELFKLNLMRFDGDWRGTFKQLVIDEGNADVLRALYAARDALLCQPSNLPLVELLKGTPSVEQDLFGAFSELAVLRERAAELEDRVNVLQCEKDSLGNELARVLDSTGWKVGRAVTLVPRAIKGFILRHR